jgi:hypothetical protein
MKDARKLGVFKMRTTTSVFSVGFFSLLAACSGDKKETPEPARTDDARSTLQQLTAASEQPDLAVGLADFGQGVVNLNVGPPIRERIDSSTVPPPGRTGPIAPPVVSTRRPPLADEFGSKVSAMSPTDAVRVFIDLDDVPFEWRSIRTAANDTARAAAVDDRVRQAAAVTSPIAKRLAALQGSNIVELWLVPSVEATVRASDVPRIAAWPEVREISDAHLRLAPEAEAGYSGLEARGGMRTDSFISHGITGASGSRSGGAVRVGQLHMYSYFGITDYVAWPHRGFIYCVYGSGCWYRMTNNYACTNGSCSAFTSSGAWTDYPTHASLVTQIMAGSIESGSDWNIADPTEQVKRSGIAPRAAIFDYVMNDAMISTMLAGMQQSITDGIDVLDFSAGVDGGTCDRGSDIGGINGKLANLRQAGVLWVKSIGDDGDPGSCNATYPGHRRDGLTIAALDTGLSDQPYDTAPLRTASSTGGMDLGVAGEGVKSRAVAVADLAAPGCWRYQYFDGPSALCGGYCGYAPENPPSGNYGCGASFAAPAVAGAAALFRHAFGYALGADAGTLLVNMLLMGDGYASGTGGFSLSGFDRRSGAGRVHMHYPSSDNMVWPWGWAASVVTLSPGQGASGALSSTPLPASVKQLKVAMTWFEAGQYNNTADITISVLNSSGSNCGTPGSVIASDYSWDMRKRITLSQWTIAGRCLMWRLNPWSIPSGQTRTVYLAYYWHSGNPADH